MPDVKTATMWVAIGLNIFQFASNQAEKWYTILNSEKTTSYASQHPDEPLREKMTHFEKMNIKKDSTKRAANSFNEVIE